MSKSVFLACAEIEPRAFTDINDGFSKTMSVAGIYVAVAIGFVANSFRQVRDVLHSGVLYWCPNGRATTKAVQKMTGYGKSNSVIHAGLYFINIRLFVPRFHTAP